jgi:hypothetical protein
VNKNRSTSRKAKDYEVILDNFRLPFLSLEESYLPAGQIRTFDDDRVTQALSLPRNHLGPLPPSLKDEVIALIRSNPILEEWKRNEILSD